MKRINLPLVPTLGVGTHACRRSASVACDAERRQGGVPTEDRGNEGPQKLTASNRRDWLATAGRYAVLGGLGLLAGSLTVGRRGARCTAAVACTACDRRAACALPQAAAARQERRA